MAIHSDIKPPTARQVVFLSLVASLTERLGYPPTRREIATAMGVKVTAVSDQVRWCEIKRLVSRGPALSARSLRLTPAGARYVRRISRHTHWLQSPLRCGVCHAVTFSFRCPFSAVEARIPPSCTKPRSVRHPSWTGRAILPGGAA